MAMLAEKKRKQKWMLNPNSKNHHWSKDSNKFGQKMLERMGWKEGKGLGRHENGLTDHIKVAYKNNSKGIGFKDSVEWSSQQDNFKQLLEELSSSMDAPRQAKPQPVQSLEEKSQNSRARVHYRKFTRGKDLSRYSEKELANIFGKKKLNVEPKNELEESRTSDTHNYGVETVAGGCMVDYFKNKKLASFEKASRWSGKVKSESEDEHVGFGFGFNTNNNCNNGFGFDKPEESSISWKNKFISYMAPGNGEEMTPRKRKVKLEPDADDIEHEIKLEPDADAPTPKKSKLHDGSKKKKSKRKSEPASDFGLANPAFEPLAKSVSVQKRPLETIVENDCEIDLETSFKKKKSKCKAEKTPDLETSLELKRKKKSKKADSTALAIDNPSFDLHDDSQHTDKAQEYEVKRKKDKKSKRSLNLSNLGSSLSSMQLQEEHPSEDCTVKQKKKKKSKGLDNPALDISSAAVTCTVAQGENDEPTPDYEVKRKKKKKSRASDNSDASWNAIEPKIECTGIENSALQISDCDIMLNVIDEPVVVTPASKVTKSTPKIRSKSVRFSKTNQEYVIENNNSGRDADERNELYDINTKVIQDGLKKHRSSSPAGFTNPAFDIKSVDKIDFCDDGSQKHRGLGLDNQGFDARAQNVEESVSKLAKTIDGFQAEVENGINESKVRRVKREDFMVGELDNSDGENEPHKEGMMLRFKYATFSKSEPFWTRKNDASATWPKKSYKHLIRGDIILGFKDSNLHKIDGYGLKKSGRLN